MVEINLNQKMSPSANKDICDISPEISITKLSGRNNQSFKFVI